MQTLNDFALDGNNKLDLNMIANNLLESFLNSVIDALADDFCKEKQTCRNGYRKKPLQTCIGEITLNIPKVRSGSFFPQRNS